MKRTGTARRSGPSVSFGKSLRIEHLTGLTAELKQLRDHQPLVQRKDGKYEGDILGFVRGLRLSAHIIYFLRERLSGTNVEVSWGHLLDSNDNSCSPECDVIVHSKGRARRWNGYEKPIMDFAFIEASSVRAVISCKSSMTAVDRRYSAALRKYGVRDIFLFAECCKEAQFTRLRDAAKSAGYRGLWCLYFIGGSTFTTNESMYVDFGDAVFRAVK